MMNFSINAKELKTMLEKGITAINKKAVLPNLRRIYFRLENGTLKVLGTDLEQYVEVRTDHVYDLDSTPGVFGIDDDDIKVITKMNGEMILEEKEKMVDLKCGKKVVSIHKYNDDVFALPVMDSASEEHILTLKESWLLETITNLNVFTSDNEANKMMQTFHFNTMSDRVEALDGYRIGMRSLEGQRIEKMSDSLLDNVLLRNVCVPVFKKVMDKKSDADIKVFQDKKYVKIEGKDFTYIQRRLEGKYFEVNNIFSEDYNYSFTPDRDNMLSVMKYDCDLLSKNKLDPVIFHSENGSLYTFIQTYRYEVLDEIDIKETTMSEDMFIGFNPRYIMDAFNVVDADYPVCRGMNNKAPMIIEGSEYSFLVLPVRLKEDFSIETMVEKIKKDKAA